MIKRLYLAITAFLVGPGCALLGEKPVEYIPYEVKVPIAIPCAVDPGPEPDWATKGLRKADTLDDKVKSILAEREQHLGYEERLKAATDGCR